MIGIITYSTRSHLIQLGSCCKCDCHINDFALENMAGKISCQLNLARKVKKTKTDCFKAELK